MGKTLQIKITIGDYESLEAYQSMCDADKDYFVESLKSTLLEDLLGDIENYTKIKIKIKDE